MYSLKLYIINVLIYDLLINFNKFCKQWKETDYYVACSM